MYAAVYSKIPNLSQGVFLRVSVLEALFRA